MSLPSSSSMVRPHHRLHGRSGRVVAAGSAFAALLLVAVVLQGKGSGSGHGRSELLSEVGTVWADPWSLNPGSAVSKAAAVAASDMVMAHTMAKVTSLAPAPSFSQKATARVDSRLPGDWRRLAMKREGETG